jgi:hypothetical protein
MVQYTKIRYKLCNLKNEICDEFHYLFSCFILVTKENSALKSILETNPILYNSRILMTYTNKCDLKK